LAVLAVTASSYYRATGRISDSYHPARLIEGRKDFGGWISEVGGWNGAWLEFRFARAVVLAAVEIVNGLVEEEPNRTRDDFYYHLRVGVAEIVADGAVTPLARLTLADVKTPQLFPLEPRRRVAAVRFMVRDVHRLSPTGAIKPFDVVGLRSVEWQGWPE
jgi:hypothetical protein